MTSGQTEPDLMQASGSMLLDAINAIVSLTRSSSQSKVAIEAGPGQPRPRHFLVDRSDCQVEWLEADPPLRQVTLHGVQDVVKLVEDEPHAMIFVSRDRVTAILDKNDRREWGTLPMRFSRVFLKLLELEASKPEMTPREVIRLMRFDLPGGHAQGIIDSFRNVDFKRTDAGSIKTEHGREALGRAVEAEVQGVSRIPETFKISVAPFAVPGGRGHDFELTCGIDIDPVAGKVQVRPIADQLDIIVDAALFAIASDFRKLCPEITVIQGDPTSCEDRFIAPIDRR